MVGSHVAGVQVPPSKITGLPNCFVNRAPLSGFENQWMCFELFTIVALPRVAWRQIGRAITIMKPIDGAPFVAMQPRSVSAKGNQISERYIGIVPHDEDEETLQKESRHTVRSL